jgi:hypothetical protein
LVDDKKESKTNQDLGIIGLLGLILQDFKPGQH